jgi:hypothetical protein
METVNSRRAFMGKIAAGATAGLAMLASPAIAGVDPDVFMKKSFTEGAASVDKTLKAISKKEHPVAYDISQANPWGFIWSNVYYLTNSETGTQPQNLGVLNVLRHHGILFSFEHDLIKKYKLGEVFHFIDPVTNAPAVRNTYWEPVEGALPLPGLLGIDGLQKNGVAYCVCDMAYKVYSGMVATSMGLKGEDVYKDFVAAKLPGIELAPSGVWVLGRLAENRIAYIDASVG